MILITQYVFVDPENYVIRYWDNGTNFFARQFYLDDSYDPGRLETNSLYKYYQDSVGGITIINTLQEMLFSDIL